MKVFSSGGWPRLLLVAAMLVTVALAVGLAQNTLSPNALGLFGSPATTVRTYTNVSDLLTELRSRKPIVIDARSAAVYEQGHISGALSVPYQLRSDNASRLVRAVPSSTPIVVYCDVGCDLAPRLAGWLSSKGWTHVAVLDGGYSAWTRAGLATRQGASP